jgi:hypothetical protein
MRTQTSYQVLEQMWNTGSSLVVVHTLWKTICCYPWHYVVKLETHFPFYSSGPLLSRASGNPYACTPADRRNKKVHSVLVSDNAELEIAQISYKFTQWPSLQKKTKAALTNLMCLSFLFSF